MTTTPLEEKKISRTYAISPKLFNQFKLVCEKDMRKYSNIIEQAIVRYIRSKT